MCEYCEKGKRIKELEKDNIYLQINYKHLHLIGNLFTTLPFARDVIINYCPMCGRKLGEYHDYRKKIWSME